MTAPNAAIAWAEDESAPLDDAEILTELVLKLVDQPDKAYVEEKATPNELTLFIHVADKDRGRVIGTKGANIKLIRNLFAIYGARQHKRITIEIAGDRPRPPQVRAVYP